jgi:hypothetical protein
VATVVTPRQTLSNVTLNMNRVAHLRDLSILVASIVVGGAIPLVLFGPSRPSRERVMFAGAVAIAVGVVCVLACAVMLQALTAIEAKGLQLIGRTRGWRVTPAIAQTIVAHGSVGWVIAAVTGSVFGVLSAVGFDRAWNSKHFGVWFNWPVVFAGLALLGVLAGFLVFEVFAYVGVRRLRFANRARPAGGGAANEDDAPGGS